MNIKYFLFDWHINRRTVKIKPILSLIIQSVYKVFFMVRRQSWIGQEIKKYTKIHWNQDIYGSRTYNLIAWNSTAMPTRRWETRAWLDQQSAAAILLHYHPICSCQHGGRKQKVPLLKSEQKQYSETLQSMEPEPLNVAFLGCSITATERWRAGTALTCSCMMMDSSLARSL